MYAIENDDVPISADVYLSYDYEYKKVMYAMNIDENIAPASITKLMTAILSVSYTHLTLPTIAGV